MTFGDILTAVCTDGIDAGRRADAKEWVKARHAWLWGAQPWTFKNASAAITFAANQQVAAAPADLHAVFSVYDAHGDPVAGIRDIRKFFDIYNTLSGGGSGPPEAYTVVNGQVLVGPQGDGSTGQIVYQKAKPALVADADPTGLPDGFDLALVFGAKATGYKLTNVPLAEDLEADFAAAVTAMENDWLDAVFETGGQVGAFRPGQQSPAWRY
jgi:hypothetical protein